jgi:tetratricopeptide (TPR) repeat protein
MNRTRLLISFAAALSFSASLPAQERHVHGNTGALGSVAFPNSGNPAAQSSFLRGLALLHSFEYEEAAEAFREAQRADPRFAMAFWGEALTYIHPLWGEDDATSARNVLAKLGRSIDARLAKAATSCERAYGAAVEALFADGTLPARLRGFADGMRRVAAAYPNDPEAAAFTSLALMAVGTYGELPSKDRSTVQDDAVTYAERVFKENPQHPGGAHYLIHATDDPARAARGLEAARRYAEIAPAAEHALHMPSHIFVQLGLWRDLIASNESAWAASRAEVAARKLTNADLSFHSLEWLQYGYLQTGRYRASRETIDTARQVLNGVEFSHAPHVDARYAVARLEFQHAAITGEWSGEICKLAPTLPQGGRSPREQSFEAVAWYQAVLATAMCGRPADALLAVQSMPNPAPSDNAALVQRVAALHVQLVSYIRGGENANGNTSDLLASASQMPSAAPIGPPPGFRPKNCSGRHFSGPADRAMLWPCTTRH